MSSELIPIAMEITQGCVYSVWAPLWREGDDVWEAFLGRSDKLLAFPTIGELYAFCREDSQHDIADHPTWENFINSPVSSFNPSPAAYFDIVGVMGLAAQSPSIDSLRNLNDIFDFLSHIGQACNITEIEEFFHENPLFLDLPSLYESFLHRQGRSSWLQIQQTLLDSFDNILDSLESYIDVLTINSTGARKANDELKASAITPITTEKIPPFSNNNSSIDENIDADNSTEITADDSATVSIKNTTDTPASLSETQTTQQELTVNPLDKVHTFTTAAQFENTPWFNAGIDPIKIISSEGTYWALRCYLKEKVIFWGEKKKIFRFTSETDMINFIASTISSTHSFSTISTFPALVEAAQQDLLPVIITADNTYDLTNIAYEISHGPKKVTAEKLEMAYELISDYAQYAHNQEILTALEPSSPLGWFVEAAIEIHQGNTHKLCPPAPYDQESEQWAELEKLFLQACIPPS